MRMSSLFGQTLRENPTEAEVDSHKLLLRAGFIRQLGAGIFTLLPLGFLAIQKIEVLMRQAMSDIDGQEIRMPVVHPADIWKETGRWFSIDDEMARFQDRNGHDMVLAMTHEEIVADLVRQEIRSYRQLPALLYHFQTKFRDDPRSRAGLLRVREFTMLDSYSLASSTDQLDKIYQDHYKKYLEIFSKCNLPVSVVQSDSGMMGGTQSHEFMYLTDIGEDTIMFCPQCGYTANLQTAVFTKPVPVTEEFLPSEKIPTPGVSSIEDLSNFLHIPKSRTAKAVFYLAQLADSKETLFVFALLRGDMTINETKLSNAISASGKGQMVKLTPAEDADILKNGATPGYASPLGLDLDKSMLIVDDLIPSSFNLVAGANQEGYHLLNTNYGRDYKAHLIADIASAQDGSLCPVCANPMQTKRGVEVGHIFKLGTKYSKKLDCTYLDASGEQQFVIMGSYGIGLGRLLACVAEEHNDDKGLIWPISVAPFPIHLVVLPGKDHSVSDAAEQIYQALRSEGLTSLFDDRDERAGVKFNDADLIGLPIRVTLSERSLSQGGAEVKLRNEDKATIIKDDLVNYLKCKIIELEKEII
ncbi:MAG: proline--tRNA ligase [Anaerolineaceae bacterium]|nr:proline--tRNA ligase [Anaerolineaceae bacterium]